MYHNLTVKRVARWVVTVEVALVLLLGGMVTAVSYQQGAGHSVAGCGDHTHCQLSAPA